MVTSAKAEAAEAAARFRDLARRCRDLAEMTAVPDVTLELERIARALEHEARLAEEA